MVPKDGESSVGDRSSIRKEKEREMQQPQSGFPQDQPPSSPIGRIGSSMYTLFRETVLRPDGYHTTSTLAAASSSSGKEQPSLETSRTGVHDSNHDLEPSMNQRSASSSQPNDSFRAQAPGFSRRAEYTQHDFDSFQSTSYFTPLSNALESVSSDGSRSRYAENPDQIISDGAAVVALLSDPNCGSKDSPIVDYSTGDFDQVSDLFKSAPDDAKIRYKIAAQLPAAPNHQVPSPLNPLNLLPSFNSGNQESSPFSINEEIGPWLDVLTRYHDDVWGDLLPLVKNAREEIDQAKGEGEASFSEGPAAKRLGMILRQLVRPRG